MIRHRWPLWVAAVAAALSAVLIIAGLPGLRGNGSSVRALKAYALSEPEYPEYPQRVDGNQVERGAYQQEYKMYQIGRGTLSGEFTAAAADFSKASSQIILSGVPENIIYSPVGFWIALAMLSETTDGDTRQQILDALGMENIDDLRQQTKTLWRHIYKDDGVASTRLASSIWINSDLPVQQEPLDALAEHYYAGSYSVDMGTDKANRAVAAWVDSMTEGLLADRTSQIETEKDTIMQIYSTLYYTAKW